MTFLQWRACYGCWRREVVRFLKDPFQTIVSEVFSDLLLFALIWLIHPQVSPLVVPGLILYAAINVMFSNLKMTLFIGRLENVLKYQLIAPISRTLLMWIFLLASTFRAALIATCIYVILFLLGVAQQLVMPWYFILTFAGACIAFGSISLTTFLYTDSWNAVGAIDNYVKAPFMILSGCFFSLAFLPSPFKNLILWNPVYHFVNLFRFFYDHTAEFPWQISLAICTALTVIATAIAWIHFKKGLRLLH